MGSHRQACLHVGSFCLTGHSKFYHPTCDHFQGCKRFMLEAAVVGLRGKKFTAAQWKFSKSPHETLVSVLQKKSVFTAKTNAWRINWMRLDDVKNPLDWNILLIWMDDCEIHLKRHNRDLKWKQMPVGNGYYEIPLGYIKFFMLAK